MKFKVVSKKVLFKSGVLGLTEAQYAIRSHALEETEDKGIYRVISDVEFKRGEIIDIESDFPKEILELIDEVEIKKRGRKPADKSSEDEEAVDKSSEDEK